MKANELAIVLILAAAIIIAGPIFTILALNTLFNAGIELNFGTWFAALWLTAVVAHRSSNKS